LTLGRGCATRVQHWIGKHLLARFISFRPVQNQAGRESRTAAVSRKRSVSRPTVGSNSLPKPAWMACCRDKTRSLARAASVKNSLGEQALPLRARTD